MNENDRTTLEQAIYEEMELTPEMIRSIRTLCGVCLCSFVESKAFKIAIHPVDIYRIGQDDPAKLRGWKKYVFPIYTAYNGKCRKDALPMKF